MREAAEVDRIGEAVAAACEALVAARGDDERVARRDRLRPALPQLDQHAVERHAVRLHLDGKASVSAACKAELASGEPAVRESIEPGGVKRRGAGECRDRTTAAKRRIGEIDGAARVAEIGRAGRGVEPPAGLIEPMSERAEFRRKRLALAAHLAERALRE